MTRGSRAGRRAGIALGCLVASVIAAGAVPPAQIAVSPSRFDIEIGPSPTTEALRVFNFSDRPVEVKASVAHWELDRNSRVVIIEPTEQSLDQWIVMNPLRFEIPAGGSQTLRFSVRPKTLPDPGEHRAMIYLEEVLSPDASAPVRVKFKVGVAVYAVAGEVTRRGRLNSVRVIPTDRPLRAAFDITSEGSANVRLTGQYAVWRATDYPGADRTSAIVDLDGPESTLPESILTAGRLPSTPVLPGTRRGILLEANADLPPGNYILDLNGRLGDEVVDQSVPFSVAGAAPTVASSLPVEPRP